MDHRKLPIKDVIDVKSIKLCDLYKLNILDKRIFGDNHYSSFCFRQFYDIANELFLVAYDVDAVGYALGYLNQNQKEAWILAIGVLPYYQGNRIGFNLLDCLVTKIKKYDIGLIKLTVKPNNKKAINLYKKYGFCERLYSKDYFGKNDDRIIMELNL